MSCYSGFQASFPDAQATQKKNGNEAVDKSEPYLGTQGAKTGFSISRNADHTSIRCQYVPITAKYALDTNREMQF